MADDFVFDIKQIKNIQQMKDVFVKAIKNNLNDVLENLEDNSINDSLDEVIMGVFVIIDGSAWPYFICQLIDKKNPKNILNCLHDRYYNSEYDIEYKAFFDDIKKRRNQIMNDNNLNDIQKIYSMLFSILVIIDGANSQKIKYDLVLEDNSKIRIDNLYELIKNNIK